MMPDPRYYPIPYLLAFAALVAVVLVVFLPEVPR